MRLSVLAKAMATWAVLSIEPSSTIIASQSDLVWSSKLCTVVGSVSAELKAGIMTEMLGFTIFSVPSTKEGLSFWKPHNRGSQPSNL